MSVQLVYVHSAHTLAVCTFLPTAGDLVREVHMDYFDKIYCNVYYIVYNVRCGYIVILLTPEDVVHAALIVFVISM